MLGLCEEQHGDQCNCGLVTVGELAGEEVKVTLGMWGSEPFYAEWAGAPLWV